VSNLPKFIALEKVFTNIGHGQVNLGVKLRNGDIVGVTTTGTKITLYNQSDKDINTNQTAVEYIAKRILQQLENQKSGELTFKVTTSKDKIKKVDVESKQTI
jgi:hypothetical protein